MGKLIILNLILMTVIAGALVLVKKTVKTEKQVQRWMLIAPLLTILSHYSNILWNACFGQWDDAYAYLVSNPNLVLPIYPCNVVMWCALVYPFLKKEKARHFLENFIFLFGLPACLIGMMANVDFIRNPTLTDFHVTKSILAHAFMLFNVMLLPVFRRFRLDLNRNMPHLILGVFGMGLLGAYCNLLISVIGGKDMAYSVNSMFLLHSPFDGLPYLVFPVIAALGVVLYFLILFLAEEIVYKKGQRWYSRRPAKEKKQRKTT